MAMSAAGCGNGLWPEVPADEIPIRHITNGVHFRSWISQEMNQLYDRYLGPTWREEPADNELWERAYSFQRKSSGALMSGGENASSSGRATVRKQRLRRGAPEPEIEAADEVLDPDCSNHWFRASLRHVQARDAHLCATCRACNAF